MNPNFAFDVEDCTEQINNTIKFIGWCSSITDDNSRQTLQVYGSICEKMIRKAINQLIQNNNVSPVELAAFDELIARNKYFAKNIKSTISTEQAVNALKLIELCGNTVDINDKVVELFNSNLDAKSILKCTDAVTDYDYSLHFPTEYRNVFLFIRKTDFNIIINAINSFLEKPSSQSNLSFETVRDLKKAREIILVSNNFVEEILKNFNKAAIVAKIHELLNEQ